MHFIPLSPQTKTRRREGRRRGGKEVSEMCPPYSTRIRNGGGRRWRACIKRWNVATLSPGRRGDTARPTQGDRRKPRERRRNPRSRRVGGAGNPQSSTRRRNGGGRRWRTCIKRWNVATLSPRRRGDTARPTQGDRRKPRERRHNPRSRRVGGTGKPQSSTRIRSGGGRRWSTCIKRWNVATLSPRRRGDTARPTSTQPEESVGRLPGWIKIPSRPGTCIRRGSRAPQAADHRRGERAKRGETTSRRSGYSPAGIAGCAPEAGGSSVAMGDCPLSAGKNSTPSVPPGRWAVRRKRINVDIWRKFDVVNEIRAPLRRTSVIAKASPPQPSRHNRKPRGTAGARKSDRATLRRPSGTAKANPPQPPRHNRKPRGTTGA